MKNRKFILAVITVFSIVTVVPRPTPAFFGFGSLASIPYLANILVENYRRFRQLQVMLQTARQSDGFLRVINAGLENTIGLLGSLPIKDERILDSLKDFKRSYNTVAELYGKIPKSKEAAMQLLHDQSIAESFKMVANSKTYSKRAEDNSRTLRAQSRGASPKGAARMAAESNALILDSLSQLIRLQGQSLKLQGEEFGMKNKAGKDDVFSFKKINQDLGKGFKKFDSSGKLPRF